MTLRLNGDSGYVEIAAPSSAGSNTLTLPNNNGTSGQYLQTDGSGGLSWQTVNPFKLINHQVYSDSTRVATPQTAANTNRVTLLSGTYNKLSSTSNLLFFGSFVGHTDGSGALQTCTTYGGTEILGGWQFQYTPGAYIKVCSVGGAITGHTTTGSQTFAFQFFTANSTAGQSPFATLNPNNTDDPRLSQQTSWWIIAEVEP